MQIRDRFRCWLGFHTLGDYVAKPVVTERYRFGALIVRAAVGRCLVCEHTVVRATQATPRWQQRLIRNRVRRWFQRLIGDFRDDVSK